MFILGLLAFLQTVFIPGFLLIKYLDIDFNANTGNEKNSIIRRLVYGFALSLLSNYLLVFALNAVGIYKPLTLYVLLFIEGVLLIYYWAINSKTRNYRQINLDVNRRITSLKQFFASHSLIYNFLFLLSVGVILWYVFLFFYFLGGVFEHWDPVTGWNRFALDWAGNRLPADTWRYPQLVPANWSVSYVMMQNTQVQCFAKAIMPLFSIAVLLLFLDLALHKKKAVYLLGMIIYGGLLAYVYNPSYVVSGYVDIAVSFFAFLSFHTLYSPRGTGRHIRFSTIWLAVIFASGAAITKQAGLFILGIILVWVLGYLYQNRKTNSPKIIIGKVLLLLLTIIIITASWYIVKEIQIANGIDRSEIAMVQGVHQNNSLQGRLVGAFNRIASFRHPKLIPFVYIGIFLVFLGVFHKKSRAVTLFIVIPYALMWGCFFSYDNRNLALSLPFIAFSAAFGITVLKVLLLERAKIPRYKIPLVPLIIALLAVLIALNFTLFKKDTLIKHQTQLKMKIGNARLNDLLYQYHEKEGIKGKIITNYRYLQYLPGLRQFYRRRNTRITVEFLDYLDSEKTTDIHYLLMPMIFKSEKAVYKKFQQKLKNNEYKMIFKLGTYWFVRVKKVDREYTGKEKKEKSRRRAGE